MRVAPYGAWSVIRVRNILAGLLIFATPSNLCAVGAFRESYSLDECQTFQNFEQTCPCAISCSGRKLAVGPGPLNFPDVQAPNHPTD